MAQKVADPCRNCGAVLAAGAAFCTLCGASVANRAASPAPSSIPLGGPQSNSVTTVESGAGWSADGGRAPSSLAQTVPGIIPVETSSTAPLVAPRQVGVDPRLAAATALVPGGAGLRLSAKIIDGILPGILLGAAAIIGAMNIEVTQVGEFKQLNLTWMLVATGIASLLSLGYGIWLWLWEAKSGKTPGNLMVGLRTTNMDGAPAGLLAVFLRYLIIGVSNIIPSIGPLLVIISNAWDSNGKRQGWHDKVAHTLVFNVKAGRDPLETGGIAERENFAPATMPTISPVRSPLSDRAQAQVQAPARAHLQAAAQASGGSKADPFAPPAVQFHNQQFQSQSGQPAQQFGGQSGPGQQIGGQPGQPAQQFQNQPGQGQQVQNQSGQPGNPFAPPSAPQSRIPVDPGPITSVPGVSRSVQPEPLQQQAPHQARQFGQAPQFIQPQQNVDPAPPAPPAHPHAGDPASHAANQSAAQADDAAGETRVRPVAQNPPLRLSFDDGRSEDVSEVALIGRNPAGYDGEMISRLIPIQDSSRSVSKTHLHLRVSQEGLWVTDRNSTNGSGITRPGGGKSPLAGGTPALAEVGATVHFGDRSFVVGRA